MLYQYQSMEGERNEVMTSVSSVLSMLEEQRRVAYSRSSIELVSAVENKYPLADIIMTSSTGERVGGNLEGRGTAEFKDGHTYQGDFRNGVMHGRGRYTWRDGVVYEGEFTCCQITGVGTYWWPDGSVYTGGVSNGFRHGHGTYRTASTGAVYTGEWVWGRREGKGKLVYDESGEAYYEGDWVNNRQEGWGTRKYRFGNVYEGEWHLNKRHGRGTMHWYDSRERYSGQWAHGIQHGQGEHVWTMRDSDHAQFPLCNRYVGELKDGLREGEGTFYYASGAVYSGCWHGNRKHGRGRFVFQNGQVFEGIFDSDRMVGGALQGDDKEEEEGLVRPKTPLGSLIGDIDPSDLAAGSTTEQFNIHISRLLLPSTSHATTTDHEVQQVHCVILHYISQLKKIYHCYSSLGGGRGQQSMTKMQFWRLLKDCKLHHHGFSLFEADNIVDSADHCRKVHNPRQTLLMRGFLQALVFLAHHIYHNPECSGSAATGHLARCLRQLITADLLNKACKIGGPLYQSAEHCAVAEQYWEPCWIIYQGLANQNRCGRGSVRMRQILLLLKECGLIGDLLGSREVVGVLVDDSPLAVDGEDLNLQVEVTFLEFFEALLLCAERWYQEFQSTRQLATLHTTPATESGQEELEAGGSGDQTSSDVLSGSEVPSERHRQEEEEGGDEKMEGEKTVEGEVEKREDESRSLLEKDGFDQWKNALHTFFSEHLYPQARVVLHCTC